MASTKPVLIRPKKFAYRVSYPRLLRERLQLGGGDLKGGTLLRAAFAELYVEPALYAPLETKHGQRQYLLRLRPPEDEGKRLTDAILSRCEGLGVYSAVFVNGEEMGIVEDDDRMKAMLRSNLYYQIPNSAIYASYHGEIDIRAVYAPDGMTTPYDDMVLLVRGRAPIRCVDAEGNTFVV